VTTQILPTADLTPTGLPAFLAAMVIVMIALMFAVNRAWGIWMGRSASCKLPSHI
jgi:hypothetical protein